MLGSVARKLRFFGFDTLYIANSPDDEIIRAGINQDCDKDMYMRIIKAGAKGILLKGLNDLEDISQTFLSYGILLGPYIDVNSRCSMCNGSLVMRTHTEIRVSFFISDTIQFLGFERIPVASCHTPLYTIYYSKMSAENTK
jgi:uncharacterized protein with PIN domain